MNRWMIRLTIGAGALLAMSIALVAGFGFLCLALYQALHGPLSAPAAAALTGIAAFAVAAVCILAAILIASLRRSRTDSRRRDAASAESALMIELAGLLGKDVAALAAANPLETVLVSLASGFALGACPGLRHTLGDLIGGNPFGKRR